MRRKLASVACLALVALLAGCSAILSSGTKAAGRTATLSGRILVREVAPEGFPVGSTLTLTLADPASSAQPLAESDEAIIPGWAAPSTQPPREFSLEYDRSRVDPSRTYELWAVVHDGEKPLASGRATPVNARDGQSGIEVVLKRDR
jgi:uncharacterized lipoprotein YbaY